MKADAEPAPRQTLREKQRSLTRRALLDGAREAFEAKGYADVTIDDITSRAGTSRGTFYLYFTKGEALGELLAEAFFVSLGGAGDGAPSGRFRDLSPYSLDALRSWIRVYVDTWEKHKLLGRAWVEADVNDPEVQAITDQRVSRAVDILSEVILRVRGDAELSVDRDAARARATLMHLELQYFCYQVVIRGLPVSVDAGVEAIAQQWYAGMYSDVLDGVVRVGGPAGAK